MARILVLDTVSYGRTEKQRGGPRCCSVSRGLTAMVHAPAGVGTAARGALCAGVASAAPDNGTDRAAPGVW